MKGKKIIIAPLNWGLGHATRCVPIIRVIIKSGYTPIIASDGIALAYLQKEFPTIESVVLPAYSISYQKNLKLGLLFQLPKIWKTVKREQLIIENLVIKDTEIIGVISDNRFGVRSHKVTSIYITHQINVLSGFTTWLTSKIHRNIIQKFDECWIPDTKDSSFSGKLSSSYEKLNIKTRFLGVLSRFEKQLVPQDIDALAIISGVEPNRTLLENRLKKELAKINGKVVIICGRMEEKQTISEEKNIKIYNFALYNELENFINRAKVVVCRSGYSSIMDLAVLQKKVMFIPTKHQTEQEYLAQYLATNKIAPFVFEKDFLVTSLGELVNFSGLNAQKTALNNDLFRLFKRK